MIFIPHHDQSSTSRKCNFNSKQDTSEEKRRPMRVTSRNLNDRRSSPKSDPHFPVNLDYLNLPRSEPPPIAKAQNHSWIFSVVFSEDPHGSEHVATFSKRRERFRSKFHRHEHRPTWASVLLLSLDSRCHNQRCATSRSPRVALSLTSP